MTSLGGGVSDVIIRRGIAEQVRVKKTRPKRGGKLPKNHGSNEARGDN